MISIFGAYVVVHEQDHIRTYVQYIKKYFRVFPVTSAASDYYSLGHAKHILLPCQIGS